MGPYAYDDWLAWELAKYQREKWMTEEEIEAEDGAGDCSPDPYDMTLDDRLFEEEEW